ncbi:MAG: DNA polymerase III subunit gamma/tau [Phycisphaerales bacterium]|nr:DNA polymerase III subunit gamma/tau [Phycisphaerales bacterium]MCB9856011.1 DNA polymerase III subunit gamma/tau [Phycisphaerales bacterium]
MSYTVLARKFRSQTFDEVVGQAAITTTIRNAIEHDRIHHGYLFTGTRGVGKTSMARILAKALNCLASDKPTVTPCGKCDACIGIARGDDVDVIEIDAASNTGVDNIRELRNNAIYRPTRSRFKIYIIDEVHMLSTGAFNALLKTLEEPPGHVKFIFATTEIHKVPATIISRVQRFDFKSIPPEEIAEQLAMICKSEKVDIDDAAVRRLSRLARGSMRDALSLLDQVLSLSEGQATEALVDDLFPAAHDELNAELIDAFAACDPAAALNVVDRIFAQGATADHWCSLMINQVRDLMIVRTCGKDTELADLPGGTRDRVANQAKQFDAAALVHMITVLEELRRSVKSSGSGRALIDAAVVRLAEAARYASIESLLEAVQGGAVTKPAPRSAMPPSASAPAASVKKKSIIDAPSPARSTAPSSPPATASLLPPAASRRAPVKSETPPTSPPPDAAPAARSSSRTTQEDIRAAQEEPLVKAALDLFGGQIVEVRRETPAPKKTDD